MRKHTLEFVKQYAIDHDGVCLENEYKNNNTKMRWQCNKDGHEWEAKWRNIYNGKSWCLKCAGLEKPTLEFVKQYAIDHDGECLESEYKNSSTKMQWRCNKDDYVWKASWNSVYTGKSWCPKCVGCEKHTLEFVKQYAIEHNGVCLESEYKNAHAKMQWRCNKDGYEWKANWHSIHNSKSWCPKCAGHEKPTIEFVKQYAIEHDGECLESEYKNNYTKMRWRCNKDGHEWEAKWHSIYNSKIWCPLCANKKKETL